MLRIKNRRKQVHAGNFSDRFPSRTAADSPHAFSLINPPKRMALETHSSFFSRMSDSAFLLDPDKHPLTPIALEILFPNSQIPQILRLSNMPEITRKQMMLKESAYRQLICNFFEIIESRSEINSALEAVIIWLKPAIPLKCREIAACILRSDIVDYVHARKKQYLRYFDHSETLLNHWSNAMARAEKPIENFELAILSEVLECPIHIYSYRGAHFTFRGSIPPSSEQVFGNQFHTTPIFLYFNPLRQAYHAMNRLIPFP